jgi:isopenicillin N synthase-like dioxygenase
MERGIPLVDLNMFVHGNGRQRSEFIDQLGKAFHNTGFVGVINHGVPGPLIETFYARSKTFFSLPPEVKCKYEITGMAGQRGYTSFGKEHARQSHVGDLKEFFQIGQDMPADVTLDDEYPENIPVAEVPDFLDTGRMLYRAFEASGRTLLQAIAVHLSLDETYFDKEIEYGNSILRAIHYPPITTEPKTALRSEQHEDISLITLLVGASSGGLQVLNTDNAWVNVMPGEDEIVVNVGDMLQRLTNNYLQSTTHRVVNPPRHEWHRPRLSIPFFLHPQSSMDLTCLPGTITDDRPLAYEPITAGAYLNERLAEIGLKT